MDLSALYGFSPSVCLSVTLVIHAKMVQHIEKPFAPYSRAILDVHSLCSSWVSCYLVDVTRIIVLILLPIKLSSAIISLLLEVFTVWFLNLQCKCYCLMTDWCWLVCLDCSYPMHSQCWRRVTCADAAGRTLLHGKDLVQCETLTYTISSCMLGPSRHVTFVYSQGIFLHMIYYFDTQLH